MFKRGLGLQSGLWVACSLAGVLAVGCGNSGQQASVTLMPYDALRQKVVESVEKGLIVPDAAGFATLPDDLKDAAPDSRVVIAHDPAFGLLVGFNLSINPGGWGDYLVYSEKDIPGRTGPIRLGNLQLNVGHKSRNHWYQAVRPRA